MKRCRCEDCLEKEIRRLRALVEVLREQLREAEGEA